MAINHDDQSKPRKLSKSEAGYATDGPFLCDLCKYFEPASNCVKVEGFIRKVDCCNHFKSKQG